MLNSTNNIILQYNIGCNRKSYVYEAKLSVEIEILSYLTHLVSLM